MDRNSRDAIKKVISSRNVPLAKFVVLSIHPGNHLSRHYHLMSPLKTMVVRRVYNAVVVIVALVESRQRG